MVQFGVSRAALHSIAQHVPAARIMPGIVHLSCLLAGLLAEETPALLQDKSKWCFSHLLQLWQTLPGERVPRAPLLNSLSYL